mgnify:CR=1 FL=1
MTDLNQQKINNDQSFRSSFIKLLGKFKAGIGLLVLVIVLSFASEYFLTVNNLLNVLRQVSIIGIVAYGMTFVILSGGIDLSVGSVLALSSAITAGVMSSTHSIALAILAGLVTGALLGTFTGVLVSKAKMPAFIVTLAMMSIGRGLTLIYTGGRPISEGFTDLFNYIGGGYVGPIPFPVILLLVLLGIGYLVLNNTPYGRYVYALGGNEDATRLSGINTDKIKMTVYTISGIMAAVSGIVLASRLGSAQPQAGLGYELDAIATVVLGGTSLAGGSGGIVGTLMGALIIGVLNNGMTLLGVSSFFQQVVKGLVILLAVYIDRRTRETI